MSLSVCRCRWYKSLGLSEKMVHLFLGLSFRAGVGLYVLGLGLIWQLPKIGDSNIVP